MEGDSHSIVNASANESQSEQVTLLLKQLNNFERAPKRFMKSWRETQQAMENTTARIFLDEGKFSAWFAYFLTKNAVENRGHFLGKADCSRLIDNLESEPVESRRLLASRVAAAIQPEVEKRINSLFNKRIQPLQDGSMSQHPNKRRREFC